MHIQLANVLPVHPHTGLTAIGRRRNGAPIWPVKGGSSDGESDSDSDGADDDGADSGEDDTPLGAAGQKAYEAEKEKRKAAQNSLRPWSALARELGVKTADELRALLDKGNGAGAAGDGDGEAVDVERIKRETRAQALAESNERIVRSEVKAAAGGKLADPADAIRLLDLSEFEVDEDGEVDTDAIAAAIDELVKKKPYLAAQGGRRFQGSGDGGHRGGGKPDPGPGVNRIRAAYAESSKNT